MFHVDSYVISVEMTLDVFLWSMIDIISGRIDNSANKWRPCCISNMGCIYHWHAWFSINASLTRSVWDDVCTGLCYDITILTQIARFTWPTWGPSGADRTQVGPMLAPWTFLSGHLSLSLSYKIEWTRTRDIGWYVWVKQQMRNCKTRQK